MNEPTTPPMDELKDIKAKPNDLKKQLEDIKGALALMYRFKSTDIGSYEIMYDAIDDILKNIPTDEELNLMAANYGEYYGHDAGLCFMDGVSCILNYKSKKS